MIIFLFLLTVVSECFNICLFLYLINKRVSADLTYSSLVKWVNISEPSCLARFFHYLIFQRNCSKCQPE